MLEEFTPLVEMASTDEAYLDLSGTERLWGPPLVAGHRIRQAITGRTKLPCSIGIGTSKLVAKIASAMSKPKGLLYVPEGSEELFLARLPIEKLPGIGPRSAPRLREVGIRTVGDIKLLDENRLRRLFGSGGAEIAQRARGIEESPIIPDSRPKSISAEQTFARDLRDRAEMERILSALSEKVASRLRKQQCWSGTITLKYRYSDFETHTAAESFSDAVNDELEILAAARRLLAKHWNGRPMRLLGVSAGNLIFEKQQLDLLAFDGEEKKIRLHEAIDRTRGKHGYGMLRRGSSLGDT